METYGCAPEFWNRGSTGRDALTLAVERGVRVPDLPLPQNELEGRGERAVLDAVADRRRSLLDVFASDRDDARQAEFKVALDDTDIEPLVATWHAGLVREGSGSAEKYLAQVRTFIAEGERFPRSRFRRKAIAQHLAGLGPSGSTSNRYRSALMQFGRWLVEREVLEFNPVRDLRAARENPPRMTYYSPSEVRTLIERLEPPHQAFEAIMAGTGMELQAVLGLRRRDVDFDAHTVHARGGKTEWRDRVCLVTEPGPGRTLRVTRGRSRRTRSYSTAYAPSSRSPGITAPARPPSCRVRRSTTTVTATP